MSTQQTKRRRKRYQPGSAYAGDVRPKGVFSIFGNVRLFFLIGALIMLGSLAVGGIMRGSLFNSTTGSSGGKPNAFVRPDDNNGTGTAIPTQEVRQYQAAPALSLDPTKRYTAVIKTADGDISIDLLADQVPQTVNNFVFLARDGFYNGLAFHQVEPGFDVQAGDPGCRAGDVNSDLCRGSGGPGYDLTQEKPGSFDSGTLGMVNASQFFITLNNSKQFDQYTPFGTITSGLDVAQRITRGTTITSIEI